MSKNIGKFGENIACEYLVRKNYQILDRNIRVGQKEIDILTKKKEKYIFIEVKTRIVSPENNAEESLSRQKIKKIKKAIEIYIYKNNILEKEVQIDFIAINIDNFNKIANIKHFLNIY